jgi:hypothetical protein
MPLLLAVAVGSCSDYRDYYKEEFSMYYEHPREETSRRRVDSKEIVYWATNPKDKQRIGFYETWEVKLAGSRGTRECHYIKDVGGIKTIGFVTDEGVFFRFDEKGNAQRVNEYQIVATGLKVFFGIKISENLDLEEIDPYRNPRPAAESARPGASLKPAP